MSGRLAIKAAYPVQFRSNLPIDILAKSINQPWHSLRIFQEGHFLSKTPDHYKKFYWEWKHGPKTAVHYIPETENFKKLPSGVVRQVDDVPIRLLEPAELHQGIWGGEAVIKGFTKKKETVRRRPNFWVPSILSHVFYSEILDKHLGVTVTKRTMRLVDEHYGFDNYILKTSPADLMSELALKIKREMYLALARGSLYPDNPAKREEILEKYKDYIIPEEEADWYGLNAREAGTKLKIMEEDIEPVPLKHAFRKEFLEYLENNKEAVLEETKERKSTGHENDSSSSWLARVNPFAKKE